MTLLIGIDEAGYGPNYGPLCIGATAWEVKDESGKLKAEGGEGKSVDLYERLAEIISPGPDKHRIAIADSKRLYKPASHSSSSGLIHLERAILTAFEILELSATDLQALLGLPALPWYADYNCSLPIDADIAEIMALVEQWQVANDAAGIKLLDVRVRMVFPEEFNELTAHYGTKGAALSHVTIELVKSVLESNRASVPNSPSPELRHSTVITCDKHGGRNRYAALLQHHFPDELLQIVEESRPVSRYRWGGNDSPNGGSLTEICFRSKGEAELPVALASMAAKYYRELAMRAFNAFWATKIPGIKPTAGYPQDAKRFKKEIAAVQSKLGIEDHTIWRNR